MLAPITSMQEIKVLIIKLSSLSCCVPHAYRSSVPLGLIVATASNGTNNISLHYCSNLFHLHVWKWLCVHLLNQEVTLAADNALYRSQTLIPVSFRGKWWAAKNMMNHEQMSSAELSSVLRQEWWKKISKGFYASNVLPLWRTSTVTQIGTIDHLTG